VRRVVRRVPDGDVEAEVVEDDRRRLKDGRVEVRETWVVRGPAARSRRRSHTRERPRGHR
jgi:hypothetical protein